MDKNGVSPLSEWVTPAFDRREDLPAFPMRCAFPCQDADSKNREEERGTEQEWRKAQEEYMPKEQNAAAQQRFVEGVEGDYRAFSEVVAPDAIDHDPAPGQVPGPEGFEHFFRELRTAFPDLQVTAEQVVADEDHIALAYTITSTQQGPFLGFPPSLPDTF